MSAPRFELRVINDIAMRRWSGRTTVLSTHRSRTGAQKALGERLRSHSLCASAYEIGEVSA